MSKKPYPLPKVYGLMERGPVTLLTTAHGSQVNVMTMSWHSMLEFEPPLIGCVVSDRGFTHTLLRLELISGDRRARPVRSTPTRATAAAESPASPCTPSAQIPGNHTSPQRATMRCSRRR